MPRRCQFDKWNCGAWAGGHPAFWVAFGLGAAILPLDETSCSYRFDTPDRVVVFTGDTGPSDAVTELTTEADLLVSEVNSVEDIKQQLNSGDTVVTRWVNNEQWQ